MRAEPGPSLKEHFEGKGNTNHSKEKEPWLQTSLFTSV